MLIMFKCPEENLTDIKISEIRPMVGDSIVIGVKEYTVKKVLLCLEKYPKSSELIITIKANEE